jgi:hypothetical protein
MKNIKKFTLVALYFTFINMAFSQKTGGAYYQLALSQFEAGLDSDAMNTFAKACKLDKEIEEVRYLYLALGRRMDFAVAKAQNKTEKIIGFSFVSMGSSGTNYYLSDLLGWWEGSGQVFQFYNSPKENRIRILTYEKQANGKYIRLGDFPLNVIKAVNGEYYFEILITILSVPMYQPFRYRISNRKLYTNSIESDLLDFRTSSAYMSRIVDGSLKNDEGGTFRRVTVEEIKSQDNSKLALGLLLLLGVAVFSGDGGSQSTSNNATWDPRSNTPYGYDYNGSPVYDKSTPLYYDQYGNKKW